MRQSKKKKPLNLIIDQGGINGSSSQISSIVLDDTSNNRNFGLNDFDSPSSTPDSLKSFNIEGGIDEGCAIEDIPFHNVTSPEASYSSPIMLRNSNFDHTPWKEKNDDSLGNKLTISVYNREQEKIVSPVQEFSGISLVSLSTEKYGPTNKESFVTAKDQSDISEDSVQLSHNQQITCFHDRHSNSKEGPADTLVDLDSTEESKNIQIVNKSALKVLQQEENFSVSTKELDNAKQETSELKQKQNSEKQELNKNRELNGAKENVSKLTSDLGQEKSNQQTPVNNLNSKITKLTQEENQLDAASHQSRKQSNYAFASFILFGAFAVGAGLTMFHLAICISLAVAALTFLAVGCYCLYEANTALSNVEVDNDVNTAVVEV